MSHIENKTQQDIQQAMYDVLIKQQRLNQSAWATNDRIRQLLPKLSQYRWCENVYDLFKGRNVKTVRFRDGLMRMHGKLMEIKFLDTGIHLVCMRFVTAAAGQFNQIPFDDVLVFQELTQDEIIICALNQHLVDSSF